MEDVHLSKLFYTTQKHDKTHHKIGVSHIQVLRVDICVEVYLYNSKFIYQNRLYKTVGFFEPIKKIIICNISTVMDVLHDCKECLLSFYFYVYRVRRLSCRV